MSLPKRQGRFEMSNECLMVRSFFDQLLDSDLSEGELSILQRHIKECRACRIELKTEKEIIEMFRHLPELQCPENVLDRVRDIVLGQEAPTVRVRKGNPFFQGLRWGIISGGLAVAIIVLLLIKFPILERGEPVQIDYSQEEVRRTRTEALWSLVFVAEKVNRVEKDAVETVFLESLPRTLRKGVRNTIQTL